MKTIVALVDLSDLTFKVLKEAHDLAKAFSSKVVILHVVPKEPAMVDAGFATPMVLQDPSEELRQQHYSKLIEMRDSLVKFGVHAIVRQMVGACVESVLAESRKFGG